jgi:protein-S-isoprenylcysteine O-methyltransferase Ste14
MPLKIEKSKVEIVTVLVGHPVYLLELCNLLAIRFYLRHIEFLGFAITKVCTLAITLQKRREIQFSKTSFKACVIIDS